MSERIAKYMARLGVCSRREAEKLILQQRVSVNGQVIESPAFNVEGTEKILLDGEKLPEKETTRLWLYYKPVGLLTTRFIISRWGCLPLIGTIKTGRLFLTICRPECRA